MEELRGKVAVVTGAADGIGRAIARAAGEAGMRVVLADVDARALEAATSAMVAQGVDAIGVVVDVASAESVDAMAAHARERFGAVHLLVNNAGIASAHAAWEAPLGEWKRMLDVNLMGVVHGVRAFIPGMLASGEACHVVNVASAAGLVSAPGLAAYCASKFGVVGLSEALHHDLRVRKTKIGVSVVCPAWVKTSIAEHAMKAGGASGDAVTDGIRGAISGAVDTGIAPETVAAKALDAVRAGTFYVITHNSTKAGVSIRAKDIVEGRAPTLFPVDAS